MVLTVKTLIIFDTNALIHKLRSDRKGNVSDVVYDYFEFGSSFKNIEFFINDKDLTNFVELAIPRIVIDEIKKQKVRTYNRDLKNFLEIHQLFTKVPFPNHKELHAPDKDFNYQAHMEQMAEKYLSGKKIRLIDLPDDDHLKEVFQRIIHRALDFKPPFNQNGEQFKDALIWESILSYKDIKNFDKIILFTADQGFNGCEEEFQQHLNRYFSIHKDSTNIQAQLERDYAVFIENQSLAKFARTDYFKSHLEQQLERKVIVIGSETFPITSFNIIDQLDSMDSIINDDESEEIIINSRIKIVYTKPDGQEEANTLTISTFLDETKTVNDVRFDKELLDQ